MRNSCIKCLSVYRIVVDTQSMCYVAVKCVLLVSALRYMRACSLRSARGTPMS
jgi:hypothetical protein